MLENVKEETKKALREQLDSIPAALLPVTIQLLGEAFNEVLKEYEIKAAIIAENQRRHLVNDFLEKVETIKGDN